MLIFIHGEDTFRSREKLHELILEFKKKRDPQGFNVVRLDGGELTWERFRHEALSPGFLAPKRMIVIERLLARGKKETGDAVAAFLSAQPVLAGKESNVIVFWEEGDGQRAVSPRAPKRKLRTKSAPAKARATADALRSLLQAQEYVFAFPRLDDAGLKQWVYARTKEQETAVAPAAVDRLAAFAHGDVWRLDRELRKLAALRTGGRIEAHDVIEIDEAEAEPTGFSFTDAVASRSLPASLTELHALAAAGVEPLMVHGMLIRLFRTVALVKSYFEDGARDGVARAAEELGLHPFVVKKTAPAAQRFSWEDLREAYGRLLELDLKLKRQGDDPYLPLELFVVNLDNLSATLPPSLPR